MTTDLQARLPLERMKDVVDRALKAERGLDGSDPRLRTYANARAKVEKEFWGYHADLLNEIARLTAMVERLEDDCKGVFQDHHDLETKADALAGMLKSVDTKALVDMADEYECGENCKNRGPMDMETGVVDCRLDNAGVGCRFVIAEEMRDFAWAKQAALTDYQGDGK